MKSIRLVPLIAVGLFLAHASVPRDIQADQRYRGRLKYQPKVLRYDEREDKFYHASSVMVPPRKELPPGNVAYHGNRLSRYRFIGPQERGGIYAAMEDFNTSRNLDPANYRYRNY